jgi:pimeloyl-ACP methyl ester carboxylesterase
LIDIGPAPGRLIDVSGRKLHVHCTGPSETGPTVILEAGASSFAIDWALVQPEIARSSRVCSYDRAGSGWSDPRTDVETPARIVTDLHVALDAAGEKPPYVMVGASAGGLSVRLYQLDYPTEVIGLVLVDPSSEDRLFTMYRQRAVPIASLTAEQLSSTLPIGAVPIPSRAPQTGSPFDRLAQDSYQLRITFGLAEVHAGLARVSTNSRHEVVPTAGHEIHLFTPSVVVRAIQDVAVAARERRPLVVRP